MDINYVKKKGSSSKQHNVQGTACQSTEARNCLKLVMAMCCLVLLSVPALVSFFISTGYVHHITIYVEIQNNTFIKQIKVAVNKN